MLPKRMAEYRIVCALVSEFGPLFGCATDLGFEVARRNSSVLRHDGLKTTYLGIHSGVRLAGGIGCKVGPVVLCSRRRKGSARRWIYVYYVNHVNRDDIPLVLGSFYSEACGFPCCVILLLEICTEGRLWVETGRSTTHRPQRNRFADSEPTTRSATDGALGHG